MLDPTMPRDPSPTRDAELGLCIACCRWPHNDAALAQVRAHAEGVDWKRFLAMVNRHRVHGLARRALRRSGVPLPAAIEATLSKQARDIAVRNVAMVAEYVALDEALAAAGIPALFVKGLTLARLAYGDLGIKANHDIDILVAPDDLLTAVAVIEARGFCLIVPGKARAQISTWHRYSKESSWRHVDTGRIIDLHTALTDSPLSLVGVGVRSLSQRVAIAGARGVATLTHDDLFAYLAVHGASSGWQRLKWIADFAALFGACSDTELRRLHTHAAAIGAGRAGALAVLLGDRIFDWRIGDRLRDTLVQDRAVAPMLTRSLAVLRGGRTIRDVTETRFGTLPIHRIHFALLPDWRYKADVLRSRIGTRLFGIRLWPC